MNTWIALFRGINVGGHRKLPMKELVAEFENLGLSGATTYIQSGNVVFRSAEQEASALSDRIARAVQSSHGFQPQVIVLSIEEFRAALAATPFAEVDAVSKTVHLYFLAEPSSNPDLDGMDEVKTDREQYVLAGKVLYLYTPDGFGRSKLAKRVERSLGVQGTARNWRSVTRILELAQSLVRSERE